MKNILLELYLAFNNSFFNFSALALYISTHVVWYNFVKSVTIFLFNAASPKRTIDLAANTLYAFDKCSQHFISPFLRISVALISKSFLLASITTISAFG